MLYCWLQALPLYKLAPITYWIAKKLVSVPYFSVPNLLSGEKLVEELIQDEVNEKNLVPKVLSMLNADEWKDKLNIFQDIHLMLRKNASKTAAQAVLDYISEETSPAEELD